MTFPIVPVTTNTNSVGTVKIQIHVPNHQPGHVCALIFLKILLECFFNRFWLPFIATPQCHEGTIVYFICSAKIGKVFAVLNPKRIPTFKSIKNGAPQICVLIYMTPHLTSSKYLSRLTSYFITIKPRSPGNSATQLLLSEPLVVLGRHRIPRMGSRPKKTSLTQKL